VPPLPLLASFKQDVIKMDPDKISAVLNWPPPKNVAELRSFLGLTNHYKRFLLNYSTKIAALSELTKPQNEFDLAENKPALEAFEWLKTAVTTAPVLATPDFDAPFIVVTDASGYGVGAILMQAILDALWHSTVLDYQVQNEITLLESKNCSLS
jgi:hypothetical protein